MGQRISVVDPMEREPTEPVAGLVVRTPFRKGDYRFELLRIDANDRSEWYRREGAVFGWVRAGYGRIEYGPREGHAVELGAGEFLRVHADADRRYVVGDEPLEVLAVVESERGAIGTDPPTESGGIVEPAVVGPDDLVPTVESAELIRETPFPDADVLLMRVRAAGGAAAGWHHHGENVYFGYAVDGPSETEYGPNGTEVARIGIGKSFHVPPGLVHRDTNPTDETHTGIVWLCGGEPWVVNVDGPA